MPSTCKHPQRWATGSLRKPCNDCPLWDMQSRWEAAYVSPEDSTGPIPVYTDGDTQEFPAIWDHIITNDPKPKPQAAPVKEAARPVPSGLKSTRYDQIKPKLRKWLWAGRFPLAQLVLLVGQGGIGKGFLAADLGSRITNGTDMPDGSPGQQGSVVLVSGEDDPERDIWYRLEAAGADMTRVYQFPAKGFSIPGSLDELERDINLIGDVLLVIIDPLSSFSSIALTSSSVKLRQQIMIPLEDMAKRTGVTLAMVHHTVKNGDIAGAKTLTDAARMVLLISRDEVHRVVRKIKVFKANIASDAAKEICYAPLGKFPDIKVRYFDMEPGEDAPEFQSRQQYRRARV